MNKLIIQTATVLIATLLFASVAYAERELPQKNKCVFSTRGIKATGNGSPNFFKMDEMALSRAPKGTTP